MANFIAEVCVEFSMTDLFQYGNCKQEDSNVETHILLAKKFHQSV